MCSLEYYEELRKNRGTKPKEVSEERYWYLLEVLPPCKFDGKSFYISEADTEDLHTWCAEVEGKYFELVASKFKSNAEIYKIIRESQTAKES